MTRPRYQPGTVLAERRKGAVTWVSRVSQDRGRHEVVGFVEPSNTTTMIALLDERELRELLDEAPHPDDVQERGA